MAKPAKVNKNEKFPPGNSGNDKFPPAQNNAQQGQTFPSGNDPQTNFPDQQNPEMMQPAIQAQGNPNSALLKIFTRGYRPQNYGYVDPAHTVNANRPIFQRHWAPVMMRDPHVWYGMELIKGPIISKAKFTVESDTPEVQEFVQRQIDNFWNKSISKALDCLIWGYAASEVIYEFNKEQNCIDFKDLRYLRPRDVKAVTKNGQFIGCEVSNIQNNTGGPKYLAQKKVFWTVHDKKFHRWYGRSRLEGAFDSWWEIWQPKGYRAIRHLWFYKNAFSGGVLYYPDGTTEDPETNEQIPNVIIAQEMMDRKETGSSIALPNKTGDNRDWEWEDAKSNAIPEGLLDYGDILRDEIWEGIGVPPEVAKTEDSGGFAGRRVPQQAFYSYLQEIANDIVNDFDEQILKYNLVPLAYGEVSYKIVPISILQTLQEEEMGLVTGKLPGQAGDPNMDEEPIPGEEEQELDENGDPVDPEDTPFGGKDGKIEDRKSNAFNIKEQVTATKKKGK